MTSTSRETVESPQMKPLDRGRSFDQAELDLIVQTGANALLQGPQPALDSATSALKPHLRGPLYAVSGFQWSLPDTAGTLFLEHVAQSTTDQQHALLAWLEGAARPVQVITTTEQSIFELVESGALLSSLYYRLNTIYISLGAGS